jgi:hypothetical protein
VTTYYPFWVLLIVLSLLTSLGGFLWAHRHRQFTDQERARYLPLRGETGSECSGSRRRVSREVMATAAVFGIGIAGILLTIATVFFGSVGTRP